jgi:hypothetical protein
VFFSTRLARHVAQRGIVKGEIEDFVEQWSPLLVLRRLGEPLLDQERSFRGISHRGETQRPREHSFPRVIGTRIEVIPSADEDGNAAITLTRPEKVHSQMSLPHPWLALNDHSGGRAEAQSHEPACQFLPLPIPPPGH